MTTPVATPGHSGYGWRMDDSARLERAVARRAAREVPRAPIQHVIETLAARDAARRGVDPAALLAKIRDPQLGDRLLAEAEQRANQERLARQADILLSRLPAKYRAADFPSTDFGHQAYRWLQGYRQARRDGVPPRSLVILGETGTGKTWTAAAIARALLVEDTVPVAFTTSTEFLASLRPSVAGLDADMQLYALTPVMVLDDLGSERTTEWGSEQLYRLAHDRSHNDRPTIVTSNLSGQEIHANYDRRTVERLFGGAQLIQITGPTRRRLPF